ncbi:MAG: ROK family protein, partial [Acidimicrobiia bacterium]|nr:ROK family protein [Acidimicrobiia bacterium]
MSANPQLLIKPRIAPPLDPGFLPAVLFDRSYLSDIRESGAAERLVVGLGRPDGSLSTHETVVHGQPSPDERVTSLYYAERLVKFLLWQHGASRLLVGGPQYIGDYLASTYSAAGQRSFDYEFMSKIYGTPFRVQTIDSDDMPPAHEPTVSLGRHLEGCRIGFDLGASDYKISAVIDGKPVYTDEFPWLPRDQNDIAYHYEHITSGLRKAAEFLPRVDAIGGSSAGVWIDDQVRAASLFRGLPDDVFETEAKSLFTRIAEEWNVPLNVVNDGEVTALAGSMSLGQNAVLGIAMGSSEAAGYVTGEGNITSWLNELAFAPIDYQPYAPADEWSGDLGCGVQYFCQTGVIRLAERAEIALDETSTPAQKLEAVQDLMSRGDDRVPPIFETIGVWLGYSLAHYSDFYDVAHVLVLGRVTSGAGGEIIVAQAREVLAAEFPELSI